MPGRVVERAQNGGAQQAFAHGSQACVESAEERDAVVLAGEERLDKLEIPDGYLIEFERGRVLLKAEAVYVQGVVFLRGAHVVQHRAGCNRRRLVALEAEAVERADVHLAFEQRNSVIAIPDPVLDAGAGGDARELRGRIGAGGDQHLAGGGHQQLIERLRAGVGPLELGGAKFARGNVKQREAADGSIRGGSGFGGARLGRRGRRIEGRGGFRGNRGLRRRIGAGLPPGREEVVLLLAESGIESGSRGEDAGHLTAHELLGELRVFHLIAKGDAVALAEQAGDVAVNRVVGDAAHRHLALPVAGGQCQLSSRLAMAASS